MHLSADRRARALLFTPRGGLINSRLRAFIHNPASPEAIIGSQDHPPTPHPATPHVHPAMPHVLPATPHVHPISHLSIRQHHIIRQRHVSIRQRPTSIWQRHLPSGNASHPLAVMQVHPPTPFSPGNNHVHPPTPHVHPATPRIIELKLLLSYLFSMCMSLRSGGCGGLVVEPSSTTSDRSPPVAVK